jgi:general secretion pathway protein A
MYTAFYGLREKPFALSPDPRFLFLAESHREALAHLLYGIEQGEGFIAITGEVGTGKTTLCRTLLGRLGAETEVAFLFNPKLSALELLQSIHVELGLPGSATSWRVLVEELNRFLVAKKQEGKRVLLIIDEAQNLEAETLEQIRLLSNLETETSKLIQIVLLGQPELDEKLDAPGLRQLRQRITVRWRLGPLDAAETAAYVRHRLRVAAGAERALFAPPALRELQRLSGGIPRLVNVLCDRALLAGYGAGARDIAPELVQQAARELHLAAGGAPKHLTRVDGRRPRRRLGMIAAAAAMAVLGVGVGMALVRWLDAAERAPRTVATTAAPSDPAPAASAPPRELPVPDAPETAAAAATEGVAAMPPVMAPAGVAAATPAAVDAPAPAASPALVTTAAPDRALARLDQALSARPAGAVTASAVDAALAAWGDAPFAAGSLALAEALAALEARGLSVLALQGTTLDALATLGYPALLVIPGPDGATRLAWLAGLDADAVTLAGVDSPAPLRLSRQELAALWTGEAFVVWRDFELLPDTLAEGATGEGVAWLQGALVELGFRLPGATRRFDLPTLAAVMAFQQTHDLAPDGTVGPRTKMALYRALSRYPVPRLAPERVGDHA